MILGVLDTPDMCFKLWSSQFYTCLTFQNHHTTPYKRAKRARAAATDGTQSVHGSESEDEEVGLGEGYGEHWDGSGTRGVSGSDRDFLENELQHTKHMSVFCSCLGCSHTSWCALQGPRT